MVSLDEMVFRANDRDGLFLFSPPRLLAPFNTC